MSRQVEEQQLVSPPWQRAYSHIKRCSTILTKTLQRPPHLLHLSSSTATFFYSRKWNYSWKGVVLTRLGRSMHNRKRVIDTLIVENYPGMREIMEKTLASLYTCPRGLLWRRWWKLGVTERNFFFVVKFPEVLGSTTYNNSHKVVRVRMKY
jgi:hypothetical protein